VPDPRVSNFGNLLRTDFRDIWNGKEYIDLRKNTLKGKSLSFGKNCMNPRNIRR